ncbi:hypothetical protein PYCCODRAFT_1433706 [Trametes coccinea BRFM310]|uniref:DNA replication checkpoint mediator MRC1 domain-containing protein n=1 Tax=Trametes coccinea (strain BRFM310) TaxID=1353009 RepID=A0A1Y2IT44_TRAC3|nr:hypothetical protein PYCCODRAFT_1433706 [Trametes coccinea BRFM310]
MSRSSSPIIRRAPRTYGRRRDTSEHDISFDAANTSIDSRDDSNSSISYPLDNDIPPDSDDIDASNTSSLSAHAADANAGDVSEDAEDSDEGPGRFQFSWKAKLKQIDDGDYEPVAELAARSSRHSHSEDKDNVPTRPASPNDPALDGIFGGTLSSLTSSGLSESSALIHTRAPRRISGPPAEPSSDAEVRPSTPQTSPRHPINTPQTQSSPTPPTSIEMLSKKGKGKQRERNPASFDSDERMASSSKTSAQPRKKASDAAKRVKAPTKKERIETQKVTARITAEQPVSIPRVQQNKYRLNDFLSRINPTFAVRARTPPIPSTPESIQAFTSSPSPGRDDRRSSPAKATAKPSTEFVPNGLLDGAAQLSDDSDDAFPDVSEFDQRQQKKREEEERIRQLQQTKLHLLEQQKAVPAPVQDESDDDLLIVDDPKSVAKEEAQKRRVTTAHGAHPSRGRQKQLALAKASARTMPLPRNEEEARHLLEAAAASTFAAPGMRDIEKVAITDPAMLNKLLLQQDNTLKEKIIHEKEEDWKRRGGRIKEQPGQRGEVKTDMEVLKEILKKRAASGVQAVDAEMVDDSEDEDYRPDDGSEHDGSQHSDAADENAVPSPGRGDLGEQADDEGDEEDQPMGPPPRRLHASTRRRPVAAVVSDDEDDSENQPIAPSRILVRDTPFGGSSRSPQADDMAISGPTLTHRSSISSMGDRTEDGTDKENDIRLSFDRGEDKENTAVALQTPGLSLRLSRGLGSFFASSLEGSPAGRSAADGVRSPLKELPPDDEDGDDPFVLKSTPAPLRLSTPTRDVAADASPMDLGDGNGLLEPAFSLKGKGKERAQTPSPSPLAEALPIGGGGGFSQFFSQDDTGGGFEKLKAAQRDVDISLTMEPGLQPALEVDQSLARKADEIFEKEQELALQEQQAAREEPKRELFVDENGFLTQTRPEFRSPLAMMTPSQAIPSSRMLTPASVLSSDRKPLAPLLAQDPEDDEEFSETPLRRLRRRGDSPTPDRRRSPAVSKPKNAFELLGRRVTPTKPKKLVRSAFIEGEAEESDDDAAFGFGARPKGDDDDEEDGEDQDRHLEELVDDKEIDEKTLAEEKVLEKVREHQEEDDKALEKVHLAAVQGELRARRRNRGLDLNDSDSESDDGHAVRPKAKKRRLKNDSIDALAKNEETRAFAMEYSSIIEEDEDEAIHLREEQMVVDAPEETNEDEEDQVVSAATIREQLREVARRKQRVEEFDPDDVNWLDDGIDSADEMDTDLRVREVAADADVSRGTVRKESSQGQASRFSESDLSRLTHWAKTERSSRTAGVVGRNTGGSAAITGHTKAKAGNGSFKASRASAASSSHSGKTGTKVTKTASVLSAVSSRRDKFSS